MCLLQAITDGFVTVEREGLSVRYPCRPTLLATYNNDDADLRDSFKDRIGICLSTDDYPLTLEERVRVVDDVTGFTDQTLNLTAVFAQEGILREAISHARLRLNKMQARYC
jgi:magnesium chelatase subunit D